MRRRLWIAAQTLFAVAVVALVGWQFAKVLGDPAVRGWTFAVRVEYLIPAGVLYLAAHTLWATFFVQLLWQQGEPVPWAAGVRAYFVSQLGKYVPGKVWVIGLRMVILGPLGASRAGVGVAVGIGPTTQVGVAVGLGVATAVAVDELLPFESD